MSPDGGATGAGEHLPENLEFSYFEARAFEREHNRRVRSHYLQFIEGRSFLVELGPGRGEFLGEAAAHVGRVLGVDREDAMVAEVKAQGIEAVQRDAIEYLKTTTDRPDAIVAAHLVEHLTVAQTFDLLQGARRVLEPGGVIVLVTPNPACLAVLMQDFWSDPTHARPYTLPLLEFLLEQSGFSVVESGANPLDEPGPPPQLLVPDTLGPWSGVRPTIEPAYPVDSSSTPEVTQLVEEVRRLRSGLESLVHVVRVLAERQDKARHQAHISDERLNATLQFLFGPNEIFVVGTRS